MSRAGAKRGSSRPASNGCEGFREVVRNLVCRSCRQSWVHVEVMPEWDEPIGADYRCPSCGGELA